MKSIFLSPPLLKARLFLLAVLSVVLMFMDARFSYLDGIRSSSTMISTPVYQISRTFVNLGDRIDDFFTGKQTLRLENEALKAQALILQHKAQRLAALSAENTRLRELLDSSALLDQRVIAAELVGVAPDSADHQIVLGKGENDGVFVGQPVIDAEGLVGQIIEVGRFSSRALLITDNQHSVPVLVNRNGLRAILRGTDHTSELELLYIPDTADVQVGDLLVTSGLGQRFPSGYPVAFISAVEHDPGRSFAKIKANPIAPLRKIQHFLLVFSSDSTTESESEVDEKIITAEEESASNGG
ncbi:MAG: rod shape-determining protein MreC [Pseudomonadales bacterium]|nr:rod shape-determining protein MreC [Pseudomonadales bacterium]